MANGRASACLAAQTKRWAEGIRVPGPLAGGGSTTARGRVATREESGVLGFPSRRGLTPRGSLVILESGYIVESQRGCQRETGGGQVPAVWGCFPTSLRAFSRLPRSTDHRGWCVPADPCSVDTHGLALSISCCLGRKDRPTEMYIFIWGGAS